MIFLNSPHKITCHYTNDTSRFQIVRISNIPHFFFERTVGPKGSIVFEAIQGAQLEIHTNTMVSSILSDSISCDELVPKTDVVIKQFQLREPQFIKQTA